MNSLTARSEVARRQRHSSDERQFRLLVALTFPVFLLLAMTHALIGKRAPLQGETSRLSIFAEAKAAASTAIAIGFMG